MNYAYKKYGQIEQPNIQLVNAVAKHENTCNLHHDIIATQ